MCGLTGFWYLNSGSREPLRPIVEMMMDQIEARGPDSSGVWCDQEIGLALGHRRLSIRDLSEAGHQPMVSKSGNSILAYNGEIYNATELRDELIKQGFSFHGTSDTEVVLEACEAWGIENAVKRFIGMFAFTLWDRSNRKLFLVRDRLGIKPLYWGVHRGTLFFGSQLKSFSMHPLWDPEIDRDALVSYFRFNYIPAPSSIFKGIQKLEPGTILAFDSDKGSKQSYYWNIHDIASSNKSAYSQRSQSELIDELECLLKDAVKRRMIADVPLGVFLSGGIDSSTVVALMQAQSSKPVSSFSIGFYEDDYNEAQYAKKVADHLGTDHHEMYVHINDALDVIPDIPNWYDEPFADSSQIPMFLVSKLARDHVTVALSGDGGDELFAGYNRYFLGQSIWKYIDVMPSWLRKAAVNSIHLLSPRSWDAFARLIPKKLRPPHVGDKAYKLADILQVASAEDFYRNLVSLWDEPANLVIGGKERVIQSVQRMGESQSFVELMQYIDTVTYLPDDILTKVDRASMAVSLETRVPLLDHRVVDFAWKLPLDMKIRHRQGKWLLRQVLYKHVPQHIIDRPKMGFGVPIGHWLRGPLREWVEYLFSKQSIKSAGLLNFELINQRWEEHLSGRRNWQYPLWGVLMFLAWHERWIES